jgi:GNAT superfamily N-acetyltransferase
MIVLVAELDGGVVGLAVLKPTGDPDDDRTSVAKLSRIYTEPESWGQGVGIALMDASMEHLRARGYREATLWTAEWNRARAFYEARGWTADGATRQKTFGGDTYTEVRYRIAVTDP